MLRHALCALAVFCAAGAWVMGLGYAISHTNFAADPGELLCLCTGTVIALWVTLVVSRRHWRRAGLAFTLGWVVPLLVGWALLPTPRVRRLVRPPFPSVIGEAPSPDGAFLAKAVDEHFGIVGPNQGYVTLHRAGAWFASWTGRFRVVDGIRWDGATTLAVDVTDSRGSQVVEVDGVTIIIHATW